MSPLPTLASLVLASGALAASSSQELTFDNGFWFGKFDIGGTKGVSLLVDTGSTHIGLNPGLYKPGPDSHRLETTFNASYATTRPDGTGFLTLNGQNYNDTVAVGSGSPTASPQQVAVLDESDDPEAKFPRDGIVGFGGLCLADDCPATLVNTLCAADALDECRFGIALGAEDKGDLVVGRLDDSGFDGRLTVSDVVAMWYLYGDVSTGPAREEAVDVAAPVLLDSGSATIIGPVDAVREIFDRHGITSSLRIVDGVGVLYGYFPCDDPPTLRFTFPSSVPGNATTGGAASEPEAFAVLPSAMALADNGHNNCTAVLQGVDMPVNALGGDLLWIAGQPFFRGHYLDFDTRNARRPLVGIASLKGHGGRGSPDTDDEDDVTDGEDVQAAAGITRTSGAVFALAVAAALAIAL